MAPTKDEKDGSKNDTSNSQKSRNQASRRKPSRSVSAVDDINMSMSLRSSGTKGADSDTCKANNSAKTPWSTTNRTRNRNRVRDLTIERDSVDSDTDDHSLGLGPDSDSEAKEDRPCGKCKGTINDKIKALCCEFCSTWMCLDCTKVPETMYDLMLDKEVPNFLWSCDSCIHALPTIKNIGKTLQGVKDEQVNCKTEIGRLNTKVEKLESSIDSKVQEAIEEYREREARKSNIIVHNIPESKKQEAKDRLREDVQEVSSLIAEGLEIEEHVSITSAIRLGKRDEDKTRLLRVTLENVKTKRNILAKAKKLRETEKWKQVFITPDLSPKERQKNKVLREELNRRIKEGEEDLVIRRGKIIRMLRTQSREQLNTSSSQLFRQ